MPLQLHIKTHIQLGLVYIAVHGTPMRAVCLAPQFTLGRKQLSVAAGWEVL